MRKRSRTWNAPKGVRDKSGMSTLYSHNLKTRAWKAAKAVFFCLQYVYGYVQRPPFIFQ